MSYGKARNKFHCSLWVSLVWLVVSLPSCCASENGAHAITPPDQGAATSAGSVFDFLCTTRFDGVKSSDCAVDEPSKVPMEILDDRMGTPSYALPSPLATPDLYLPIEKHLANHSLVATLGVDRPCAPLGDMGAAASLGRLSPPYAKTEDDLTRKMI